VVNIDKIEDLNQEISKKRAQQFITLCDQSLEIMNSDYCFIPIKKEIYNYLNLEHEDISFSQACKNLLDDCFETYYFAYINEKQEEEEHCFVTIFKENVKKSREILAFLIEEELPSYLNERGKEKFSQAKEELQNAFFQAIKCSGKMKISNLIRDEIPEKNIGVRFLLSHHKKDDNNEE